VAAGQQVRAHVLNKLDRTGAASSAAYMMVERLLHPVVLLPIGAEPTSSVSSTSSDARFLAGRDPMGDDYEVEEIPEPAAGREYRARPRARRRGRRRRLEKYPRGAFRRRAGPIRRATLADKINPVLAAGVQEQGRAAVARPS
jgi:hypothetical protein